MFRQGCVQASLLTNIFLHSTMQKYSILNLFLAIALTLSFTACSNGDNRGGRTDTPTSGTIQFVADESLAPIIEELREQFEFEYPQAHLEPLYIDETAAMDSINKLKSCLYITSRALTQQETAYLKTLKQLPEVFPIGYDGLAFISNLSNPDTCISVNDIKRILSGEVTKWSELNPSSTKGDIEVVFDNKLSATLRYVVDSIMEGRQIESPNIVAAKTSKEVVEYVDQTPNAIGVIGSNWLNDRRDSTNTTFRKNIHVMSVSTQEKATWENSWKPYQAYLLDGRYPFARTIYCILVDPQRALPYSFANWIAKPKGQLIIFKAGLLPYRGDITFKRVSVKTQ